MATISACACGERRIAAWSVPGWTPISSMKRPRPVSSDEVRRAGSTARPTACPALSPCWQMRGWRLPPSRKILPHILMRQEKLSSGGAGCGHSKRSREFHHPASFSALCNAPSARETGNISELARAYAGMVAEEAREMGRLGKAELVADVADAGRPIEHCIDRLLHADDIQVDLRRHPIEDSNSRKKCDRDNPASFANVSRATPAGFQTHRGRDPADAPIARTDFISLIDAGKLRHGVKRRSPRSLDRTVRIHARSARRDGPSGRPPIHREAADRDETSPEGSLKKPGVPLATQPGRKAISHSGSI